MTQCRNNLSDHSKVWIFQSDKELSLNEVKFIEDASRSFLKEWNTHGTSLIADAEVFYNRFLVFFVDEMQVKASGCSIDKMTALVKEFENKIGNSFFNRLLVAYENVHNAINTCSLSLFEDNCKNGTFTPNTIVYNNLVENKHAFIDNWRTTIKKSWHSRYLVEA